jgi:hypothetical protein
METELERGENELDRNEVWTKLRCLENKLQQSGEIVHSLQQAILLKRQETDYAHVKNNCLMIVEAFLNNTLASQKRSL